MVRVGGVDAPAKCSGRVLSPPEPLETGPEAPVPRPLVLHAELEVGLKLLDGALPVLQLDQLVRQEVARPLVTRRCGDEGTQPVESVRGHDCAPPRCTSRRSRRGQNKRWAPSRSLRS